MAGTVIGNAWTLLLGLVLMFLIVDSYVIPWQPLIKRHHDPPHSKDPEISVCDKQIRLGEKCGERPLCCRASTCQMYNSFYRSFMDCPHGVKNDDCTCVEESLASRTDFTNSWDEEEQEINEIAQ